MRWQTVLAVLTGMTAIATISSSAAAAAAPAGSIPAAAAVTGAHAAQIANAKQPKPAAAAVAGEPLYAFNTGLVLTVTAHPAKGAAVRVEANSGVAGQRWIDGAHQTLRPAANQSLCLNVPGGRYSSGVKLQLWTCNGHTSEGFGRSAPSGHTVVRYLRPTARTAFCVTSLATAVNVTVARVALAKCSGLTTQAWSSTNLDGVAGYLADAWSVQAQHPTTAGSAVTASSGPTTQLDQAWVSSYTGAREGSPVMLRPVLNRTLCAELAGTEKDGTALKLATCNGSASQQFMGIGLIFNASYTWSYLTTTDGQFCVQAAAKGSSTVRPVVLGPCAGNNRDTWMATMDLTTGTSKQYQEIYAGTGQEGLDYAMEVRGSSVVLAKDTQAAAQIWTDLTPGQTTAMGNPDGSITIRPLSDESQCLTVPGGDYSAGVQLAVQACDGAVSQEFVRGLGNSPTNLIAAGAGQFCVGAPAGIATGGPVELEHCGQQNDQEWITFFSWYEWAGVAPSATGPEADPGDTLALSGITASGSQVGVQPALGPANWNTSQDWTRVSVSGGFEIQSFYDPGLCLEAPATTAGTQLTATPCTGGADQVFSFAVGSVPGLFWELAETPRTARMCVAVGAADGSGVLPLVLQACSASATDEAWSGPSTQL